MPCIFCFQCLSRRFLKEFSVPANTVWDGKLFQLFVILFVYISMIFKATLCSLLEVRKVVNSKPERTLERLSHNLLHPPHPTPPQPPTSLSHHDSNEEVLLKPDAWSWGRPTSLVCVHVYTITRSTSLVVALPKPHRGLKTELFILGSKV